MGLDKEELYAIIFLVFLKGVRKEIVFTIKLMSTADQNITCKDCGQQFIWTAAEQEFYASKQLSAPQRCKSCRMAKRQQFNQGGGQAGGNYRSAGPRQMFDAVCSQCGKPCQIPFQPKLDESGMPVRPVLCSDCFRASRANA